MAGKTSLSLSGEILHQVILENIMTENHHIPVDKRDICAQLANIYGKNGITRNKPAS